MNDKSLGEVLSEITTEHGLTIGKLSELTNIPKRYLSAMAENDLSNMPAAPYIKGYIAKICTTLDIDQEPIIEAYNKTELKTSGKDDILPKNRFAVVRRKKSWVIVALIVAIAMLATLLGLIPSARYFLVGFVGIPSIEVNLPAKVEDRDFLETRSQVLTIEGKINPKDSIIINREPVPVSSDGYFLKEVSLDAGLNTFEIRVRRFLGRETTVIRKVFYITENLNVDPETVNYGEENI
ncbi:MAG: helix-turn-helix domain-containing protein [Parcubacteria group bacterium]